MLSVVSSASHERRKRMKFYIADTHFGQDKAAYYDRINEQQRRFPYDVDEMRTQVICDRWNEVVRNGDDVYIVGDVGLLSGGIDYVGDVLSGLRGNKHIIVGNHDKGVKTMSPLMKRHDTRVVDVCDYKVVKDNGRKVVLMHYPIAFWEGQHRGWFHLYGHVHNCIEEDYFQQLGQLLVECRRFPEFRAVNVGAVQHDYYPVTLDQIIDDYHYDMSIDFQEFDERENNIVTSNGE